MASLENRTGYVNVVFRFGGKKYTRSLQTDDATEADRLLANLEQTIRDVNSGRIVLPLDADIPTFLLSDGKLTRPPVIQLDSTAELRVSLRSLFESFFAALPEDALEESTISQIQTHRNNLLRILGDSVFVDQIFGAMACSYVRTSRLNIFRGSKPQHWRMPQARVPKSATIFRHFDFRYGNLGLPSMCRSRRVRWKSGFQEAKVF